MTNFRKRFNLDRPDRKSPLFLLPSNAALFLKGLHTRLAPAAGGPVSGIPRSCWVWALLCIGQLGFCFCDIVHVQRHVQPIDKYYEVTWQDLRMNI